MFFTSGELMIFAWACVYKYIHIYIYIYKIRLENRKYFEDKNNMT